MSVEVIKYISISRLVDKKILIEYIPQKSDKGFASDVLISELMSSLRRLPRRY